ncbi:MAG: prolyl oligopeptidase family serine peptidase [Actinomycetota bacterium]
MTDPEPIPYGAWPSPITAERAAKGSIRLSETRAVGESTTWLERRPEEQGRSVVVRSEPGAEPVDVTPAGVSVRTLVHEYGGGSYAVSGSTVHFANLDDQRLYRQDAGGAPTPITPEPATPRGLRYADLDVSPDGRRIACVRERHGDDGMPVNELVVIAADGSSTSMLASGRDFYAFPRWAPDGARVAFVAWDFPRMPWDGTELLVVEVASDGSAGSSRSVAGGEHESIYQPAWGPDGSLAFVSDRTGWWNLYREEAGGEQTNLTPMAAEFAVPMWLLGYASYGFLSDGRIVCAYRQRGVHHLALLDPSTRELLDLDLPYETFEPALSVSGQRLASIAGGPTMPTQVVTLDFSTRAVEVLRESDVVDFDPAFVSVPEPLEFPTTDGQTAYAYYYPPTNPAVVAPDGERPPLLVNVHGGPTSEADPELHLEVQFFTSRGFAYAEVNYRGSTGHGRGFRESLYGRWGVVDVDDAVAVAEHLVGRGLADPDRLLISGGSAGGWTTLCALTFRDAFATGTSYFGVSDLEPFAETTHKFESKYLDVLVGPWRDAADLWAERSPVRHADLLSRPLLILQGDEDEVVPPAQAEVIVEALERRGLPYAYLLFEGEQHGFRKVESISRSLEAELTFYGRILGFEPADRLPPLEIRNLPPGPG